MSTAALVFFAALILLAGAVAVGIARGWFRNKGSSPGFLTAFHDLQPKDKQEAIEQVIEQKAGKRWGMDLAGQAGGAPDVPPGGEKEEKKQ